MTRANEAAGQWMTTSRRGFLSALGAATAVGSPTTASGRVSIAPGTFTAADVSISSKNGRVDDVWVRPGRLRYSWDGLDADPERLQFTVLVDGPSQNGAPNTGTGTDTMAELGTETDDAIGADTDGLEGTGRFSFGSQYSLIADGPWTRRDFRNRRRGSTRTVGTIEVAVVGTLSTATRAYEDVRRAAFDVTVTRERAPGNGNGGGN